jgi:hypothetical protein
MDVSSDHEPTLIKRGMGVQLNHPITARRGTHDSRPARWELWAPHPSVPQKDGEGAYEQDEEHTPIASNGPGSRARRTATPPGYAPNADVCQIRAHGTPEDG